mmetsp:Transcript_3874/g.6584  ORF Transcript_3874/g.6584 Transcript_3874/m.6584 type:complete len:243 (-) Transcript_3874:265-993(-)
MEYDPNLFAIKLVAIHDFWRKSKSKIIPVEEKGKDAKVQEEPKVVDEIADNDAAEQQKLNAEKNEKSSPTKKDKNVPMSQKQFLKQELIGANNNGDSADIIDAMIEKQAGEDLDIPKVEEDEGDNKKRADYPEDEDKEVESLLEKFLIGSESSFLDTINIVLMLNALPNKIVDYNINQMKLFNFSILQNSLIAFQNADQVSAFEYFDEKNRDRVQKIRTCILEQKDDLNKVQELMDQIKDNV